jgi:hypothetical protein
VDSETITVTTFFDEAGDPIKIATRAYFSGTITNTASGHLPRSRVHRDDQAPEGSTTVQGIS